MAIMKILLHFLLLATLVAVDAQLETTSQINLPETSSESSNLLDSEDDLPKITNKKGVVEAVEGDNVTLPCHVVGLDKNGVIWTKGNQIFWIMRGNPVRIQYMTSNRRIGRYNTSLVIHSVTDEDAGLYTCELSNRRKQTIYQRLVISVPPTVVALNGQDFVQEHEGAGIELGCSAEGKPKPNITWERENGEQMNGIANENKYIIKSILPEDTGVYVCQASNGVGEDAFTSITLNVVYPPKVSVVKPVVHTGVNYDASLHCVVKASPLPKVVWFKGDAPINPMRLVKGNEKGNIVTLNFKSVILEDFGNYSCNALNYWGNGSATIELSGCPLPPIITSSKNGSLPDQYTLTWEVKSYSPIIYYDVLLRNVTETEEIWANVTIPGSSGSSMYHSKRYILRDLRPGYPIEAKVSARNDFGKSDWSNYFVFTTFDPDHSVAMEENVTESSPNYMDVPKQQDNDKEGAIAIHDPELPTGEDTSLNNLVPISQNYSASALSSSSILRHSTKLVSMATFFILLQRT